MEETNKLTASLYPNFPPILCFSENHLKKIEINQMSTDNYNLGANFRREFNDKSGVCIFIHKTLKFSTINLKKKLFR
jgi:hypothetical protein